MRNLVILAVIVGLRAFSAAYIDKDGVNIRYDAFLSKCRIGEDKFRRISGIELYGCVQEYGLRQHCKALNYRRTMLMCDLFTTVTTNDRNLINESCTYILASNIKLEKSPCGICAHGQVCDVHSKRCSFKECIGMLLKNGTVLGNMNGVGSKIGYQCNYGYRNRNGVKSAVCSENGELNAVAECKQTCGNPPPIANGKAVLDTVDQDTAFVTCDAWFQTTTDTVTCTESGSWTPVTCNHVQCYNRTSWDYMGKINYTDQGTECLRWDSVQSRWMYEDYFLEASVEEASNYCRNPYPSEYKPWCLVSLDGEDYEYCDITNCNESN